MSTEVMGAARRIHPLVAVAAVSVTALSLTGIAAMTGLIGGSHADPAPAAQMTPDTGVPAATAQASSDPATAAPMAGAPNEPANAAATQAAAGTAAAAAVHAPARAQQPAPVRVVKPAPAAAPVAPAAQAQVPVPAPRAAIDPSVGTVVSIDRVDISPSNNGVGAVAGGVLGGIAGHQVGGGRGKDVATVLGAVGGAIAGNAVETRQRKTWRYDVHVRSDDGSTRVLHYTTPPAFNVGDRISLKTAQG